MLANFLLSCHFSTFQDQVAALFIFALSYSIINNVRLPSLEWVKFRKECRKKGSFAISVSAVTPFLIFIRLFLLHQSQNCIQEVFTSGCKTFSWEVQQGHLNLSDLNQVENLTLTFTLQYSMNIIFGTPFIILFYCRQGYFYWIFNQWEFPGLFHRGGCWTQGGATNQLFAGWYKKQSKQLKVKKNYLTGWVHLWAGAGSNGAKYQVKSHKYVWSLWHKKKSITKGWMRFYVFPCPLPGPFKESIWSTIFSWI